MNNRNTERALLQAFHIYLETNFLKRDLEGTLDLLTSSMTGFGTGIDEHGYDYAMSVFLYRRDFEQAPDPIHYDLKREAVTPLAPAVGLVTAEIDIETVILEQKVKLKNMRVSAIFRKVRDRWLLEHKHLSLPTEVHEANEAYPVKELEERKTVLERLVRQRTRELEFAHTEMQRLATTDHLTGLYNRIKLNEVFEHELARLNRYPEPLSIILLDIDRFKSINDQYGHAAGDAVLVQIARVLHGRVRVSDCLGRWGGEEFLIICPHTTLSDAHSLADDLRDAIAVRSKEVIETIDTEITASFGVAEWCSHDNRESLMERADNALYAAKHGGRNRVRTEFCYDQDN